MAFWILIVIGSGNSLLPPVSMSSAIILVQLFQKVAAMYVKSGLGQVQSVLPNLVMGIDILEQS